MSFEFAHEPAGWCSLFNVTVDPRANSTTKFDVGCRGKCASSPAPPSPPGPAPSPPAGPIRGIKDSYYFGWSQYWLMLLDAQRGPYETFGHAQSAPNNFLGLHLHDSQFYLNMGAWTAADLHATYAHGNVLMWHGAMKSPMYQTSNYWKQRRTGVPLMPDNMGSGWIASSTCDQTANLAEGAWNIYDKGLNTTYLNLAYEFFHFVMTAGTGNITLAGYQQNLGGGKDINALMSLEKMATVLSLPGDAAQWNQVIQDRAIPQYKKAWGMSGVGFGNDIGGAITNFFDLLAPEPLCKDEWATESADAWLLNSNYGFYPPNKTYGAPLLAQALNESKVQPWVAHTTGAGEVSEGLFRHYAADQAINLTLSHIGSMQRDYGFTIFPEAWDSTGKPWGDQWYNWGSFVATLLPLERLAGVTFSASTKVTGADKLGVLTVCDNMPKTWGRASVRVPVSSNMVEMLRIDSNGLGVTEAKGTATTQWIEIEVLRLNATAKQITVLNNPFGALNLQPWAEGNDVKASSPAGGSKNSPPGHVGWQFLGAAAASKTVTITW